MKKTLVSLLVSSVFIFSNVSAMAETTTDETSEIILNSDNALFSTISDMSSLHSSVLNGEFQLNSATFEQKLSNIDSSIFSQLCWDVPTSVNSVEALNLEYSSLLADFQNKGFGVTTNLDIPEFEFGYSTNITEKFNATFGDLSHLKKGDVSLPEGWTFGEIMQSSEAQRNQYAGKFYETDAYKTIVDSISIGDCFDIAKTEMTMPSLENATDMGARLKSLSVSQQTQWEEQRDLDFDAIADKAWENLDDYGYVTSGLYDNMNYAFEMAKSSNNAEAMGGSRDIFYAGVNAINNWDISYIYAELWGGYVDDNGDITIDVDSDGTISPIAPGTDLSEGEPMESPFS